ncbi:MAG: hypothetical protein IV100_23940, partial [Myxococcales bacterium]|nr:hypothetical protein [Myxococcales bacterium]
MTPSRALLLALLFVAGIARADAPLVLKGRLEGYRGIYPFHVFALRSPDFGAADAVVAQGTADAETGRFDLPLPAAVGESGVYLYGQLDLGRQGPTLIGQQVFPLRKLPFLPEELRGVRHLFDLGDMELASVVREAKTSSAIGIALGLALLL